eukprot:g22091.t1
MSHCWGGHFRDFMFVVDKVVVDKGCSSSANIWVCTFANSQFGENFGPALEESPFFRAISMAEATVLVVDREAGALTRIWCGLELHFTDKLAKDLQVYTPSGRIGSELVTSGPLVEAIGNWDVMRNRMVRTKVKAAACVVEEVDAGLCQIHPIERRGVALGQIRAFFKQMKSEISSDCQSDFDTISTRAVVKDFLEKRYGKTAYAEKVNEGPTCAKYVIEHLWDGRFVDLARGVEWFAEARQLSDFSILWLDLCAYRHTVAGEMFQPELWHRNLVGSSLWISLTVCHGQVDELSRHF